MQVFNSVSTAIDFSADTYEFCVKHYPTVRKYTVWAALVALYFILVGTQKAWQFGKYSWNSAIESGKIVGSGYYSFKEIKAVPQLVAAETPVEMTATLEQTQVETANILQAYEQEVYMGQCSDIACHLGDWWIGRSGKALKSTLHLRRAYEKAMSAEAAIQGI